VPKGSILGPLLFLLYSNDLPQVFQGTNFVLYTDDTNILVTDKEEEVLQHKIAFVIQYHCII
jgi:Reverse transcriptase (RNA-dependent DNA polymerase).